MAPKKSIAPISSFQRCLSTRIIHGLLLGLLAGISPAICSEKKIAEYTFTDGKRTSAISVEGVVPGEFSVGSGGVGKATGTAFIQAHLTPSNESETFLNSYFSFKITIKPGYIVTLESLRFDTVFSGEERTAPVSAHYFVQSSATGFGLGKNLGEVFSEDYQTDETGEAPKTPRLIKFPKDASDFPKAITGDIEFRIYVYDNSGQPTRLVRIDNVVLEGAVRR